MRHFTALVVQIIFIAAKMAGILDWPWIWVFVPAYLFLIAAVLVGVAVYAVLHEDKVRRFTGREKSGESWRTVPALIKDDEVYVAGNYMIHIADYGHDGHQIWLKHRYKGYWHTEKHLVIPERKGGAS